MYINRAIVMSLVNVKCPNCGESIQLDSETSEGLCSYCGCKINVEETLSILLQNTTKTESFDDDLDNLYKKAREAQENNDEIGAETYYEIIHELNKNDWESTFYITYNKALRCRDEEIQTTAFSVSECINLVLPLIKSNVKEEELHDVLSEIYTRLKKISFMLFNRAREKYEDIEGTQDRWGSLQIYVYYASASSLIMLNFGNSVEIWFKGKFGDISALAWKDAIDIQKEYVKHLEKKEEAIKNIENYVQKIQKYDPTYRKPEIETKNGCYIATSIYGSYDCPQVWTLRRFRDDTLDASWFGRCFIKTYYAISPTLVKWFGKSAIFKGIFTPILDNMVKSLKDKGISDKPYNDKY